MSGEVFDVAIVGYGPVGQTLATLLGRRGWRVVVFDKQQGLYPLPRACHLDHEAMRILQASGIADEIDRNVVPAREYHLLRADLSVISDLPRGWETPSGWEASYHFYQPDIEGIFDRAAKATPGVVVRQAVTVTELADQGDEVVLTVRPEGGRPENVRARFAVGADGANSLVRDALGIPQEDLGFEATWTVVDVAIKDGFERPRIPDTGQVLDPAQPRHMAWLGGEHYRWEFMTVDGADPVEAAKPENIWPKLSRWVNPDSAVLLRSAAYTFRSLVADTLRVGRVALVGDAAHLTPPFMGQGMVAGLRDAATLSWVLDLVLRGRAPISFLDVYTASRRPHILEYIAESVRVGQMICETDPVKAAARDRVLEAQTQTPPPFQPAVGGFFVPGPLAGHLSVQPRVANAEGRLLDDVLGSWFTVLSADAADLSGLDEASLRVMSDLGINPAVVSAEGAASPAVAGAHQVEEHGSRTTDWLRAAGATWALVRPDGYVYDSGAGREELQHALAHLASEIGAIAAAP